MKIVVDTNIFIKACNTYDYELSCDAFVMGLYNKDEHHIVLDYEDNIRKEYWDNLCDNERFIHLYKAFENEGRVDFVSCKLVNKHRNELKSLKFHEEEDLVFVGVAMNADKTIITEDSDYGKGFAGEANTSDKQAVLEYMKYQMGLNVYDSIEAKKRYC